MTDEIIELDRSPSRLAWWLAIPTALVLVLLVVVLATASDDSTFRPSPLLQKPAPLIVGETLDGTTFDLAEHRGSYVVVNFFQSNCVPCIREHPELVKFDQTHREVGDAILVSLVFSDTVANAARFFEENGGGDWPILAADTGTYAVQYGVTAAPETVIIDPNGIVIDKRIGAITADWLDQRISGPFGAST